MSQAESFLGHVLFETIRNRYFASFRRSFSGVLLAVFSVTLGGAGILFLFRALSEWLYTQMPHTEVLLTLSAVLFVCALLTGFVSYRVSHKKRKKGELREQEIILATDELFKMLGINLEKTVQENPKGALTAAALAGVLLGRKLH